MPKTLIAMLGLLCLTIVPETGSAKELQSLDALDSELANFLNKNRNQIGGAKVAIDRRLKLQRCPAPIEFGKIQNRIATIRCPLLGWRITVPLNVNNSRIVGPSSTANVVKRGEPVTLLVRKLGFSISRQMLADRSGKIGDVIPVRASRRSQPILAEIIGQGQVSTIF